MKIRRTFVSAVAIGVISVATAGAALATSDVKAERIEGYDRYQTSQFIAGTTFFASGTTVAVIASGQSYPDALAASYLAGALDGPVILTAKDSLPGPSKTSLDELNVSGVIIVGGTAAVSEAVAQEIAGMGIEVDRVFGGDRYATARAIADAVPADQIGSLDGSIGRTALLASGQGFADALSGGPLAYASAFPMLLTPRDTLSPQVTASIDELGIEQVVILGGINAVTPAVEAQLAAQGVDVRRVNGDDRTSTAVAIANVAVDELNFSVTRASLARGDGFADALSGSAHAGKGLQPILLTLSSNQLGTATGNYFAGKAATLSTIHVYGGPAAVSDSTVNAAEVAAGRNP